MALVYRNENEAFFLQDFRIEHKDGKQIDAMMKYFSLGERIGMFFAGDVATIKRLIPYIEKVEPQIQISNVLDNEGPLAKVIEKYMMENPNNLIGTRRVEIIGFIIDNTTKKNECFYINSQVGMGSSITDIEKNQVKVIGSGSKIDNISLRLTNIANQVIDKGRNMETTSEVIRTHLKQIFELLGASSYNKLGISPIFAKSILSKGHFEMKGEVITAERYEAYTRLNDSIQNNTIRYSLLSDRGTIILLNNDSGEKIKVEDVKTYKEGEVSQIFDPEGLTKLFDPSQYANFNDVIYIITQYRVKGNYIRRVVERTYLKNKICSLNYSQIANDEMKIENIKELGNYIINGKNCLSVSDEFQELFERELKNHLFDHEWLSKFIQNYGEIYEQGLSRASLLMPRTPGYAKQGRKR